MRARVALLGVVALVLGGVAFAYPRPPDDVDQPGVRGSVSLAPGPRLLVVTDRHLASVVRTDPGGDRVVSDVECVCVYAAAGTGVCLRPASPWSYELVVLDDQLRPTIAFGIPGLPNRARVSASGRMVAWTTFVGGDSYAASGFSTRTGILDTVSGSRITTLEDFAVTMDGHPYRAADLNYWGVTFAGDDRHFYATLATAGHRYLVRGDVSSRTVETIAENVECPSLSPDGTRIAFKQAVGGDPTQG